MPGVEPEAVGAVATLALMPEAVALASGVSRGRAAGGTTVAAPSVLPPEHSAWVSGETEGGGA
jgi:hypothetical protein